MLCATGDEPLLLAAGDVPVAHSLAFVGKYIMTHALLESNP